MGRGKAYSGEDILTMVEMLEDGCKAAEIANALGRSEGATHARIGKLRAQVGKPRTYKSKIKPVVVEQLDEVNDNGTTVNFLAGFVVGALVASMLTLAALM